MSVTPAIWWIRLDLRLQDNPALTAAVKRGGAVIPLFIETSAEETPWQPGGASRWWCHQSLVALQEDLRTAGSQLVIRSGSALDVLREIVEGTGAEAV